MCKLCGKDHAQNACCHCGEKHRLYNCTVMCETNCTVNHPAWVCCVCIEQIVMNRVRNGIKNPYTIDDLRGKRGSRLHHKVEDCPKVKICKHCAIQCFRDSDEEEHCVFNPAIKAKVDAKIINDGQEQFHIHGRHTSVKKELI